MNSTNTCNICCENFNNSTCKSVVCGFGDCGFESCKTCTRTYLMGTTADPHCMNCKKTWDDDFLIKNLNKSFYEKDYKNHRKELLMERELSKLPETMIVAQREKKFIVECEKDAVILAKIRELNKQLRILQEERKPINDNILKIKYGDDTKTDERKKFVMSCRNENCRGYLSTQYKCDLCDMHTCPHCLELIGPDKNVEHTCNPDNVSSAEMIKKETKGCPSCGVRIFKISGCSQMWCTECKVAFDYHTGKIDNGIVHNPHYYAHMAEMNEGNAPRNPGDVLCGGLISVRKLQHAINTVIKLTKTNTHLIEQLTVIHQVTLHITYLELPQSRTYVRNLVDTENIRVYYILGKIDKNEVGTRIYQIDKKRKIENSLLHLYELISVVCIENFNILLNIALNKDETSLKTPQDYCNFVTQKINLLNNLRTYCNDEFSKISLTYNRKTLFIDDNWEMHKIKYTK